MEQENKLVVFEDNQIRRVWHNEEWWFVITDVVGALSESKDPSGYVASTISNCLSVRVIRF